MNFDRVKAIIWKDWKEIVKSKYLLYTVALFPLFMSVLFSFSFIAPFVNANQSVIDEAPFIPPEARGNPSLEVHYASVNVIPIFMLMPLMVSTILGAYTFVGEKTKKTLEPLLATPITDDELLLGKIVAIMVPALLSTFAGFLVFLAIANYLTLTSLGFFFIPGIEWLVSLALILPLISFIGVNVSVLISSKVNEERAAQQLSGLVSLPMVGLLVLNISGFVIVDIRWIFWVLAALLLIALLLFSITVKLFSRERILTGWK